MKYVYVLLFLLVGCSADLTLGQTENDLPCLRYEIARYDVGGIEVIVSYRWIEGLLHISSRQADGRDRAAYWFENGRLTKVENLGRKSVDWAVWLRRIGVESGRYEAIGNRECQVGMSASDVLWICGHPNVSAKANIRYHLDNTELPFTGTWHYIIGHR